MKGRPLTVWLACSAILLRLLFAPGYMPSAQSGWLIGLCHQGLPAGILDHDNRHDHGSASEESIDSADLCPFGMVFQTAAVPTHDDLQPLAWSRYHGRLHQSPWSKGAARTRANLPRAPPLA